MGRVSEGGDLVRRIKDSLDIVQVVASYVELSQRGANHLGLCPFHAEKTPSFSVNKAGQFFHCFGCKRHGDVIDFIMAMEGVSFPEALALLVDRYKLPVDPKEIRRGSMRSGGGGDKSRLFSLLEKAARIFERNLEGPRGVEARKYLNQRGISPVVTSRFRVGYATPGWHDLGSALAAAGFREEELLEAGVMKRSDRGGTYDLFRNRLVLPIFDMQGRVVGFGARVLDDTDETQPKYINSPESRLFHKGRLFYGLNLARRSMNTERWCVVVEGYTDVIMAHDRGLTNTVATLGTAMTEEHAVLLSRLVDRVVLLFDGDEAGGAAAGRGVEVLLRQDLDVTVVTLEEGMDPFDFFRNHGAEDFRALLRREGRDFFDFTVDRCARCFDLDTAGGRAKLARRLLHLVGCHSDPIKRELLLKKAAETVGVEVEVMRREFARRASSSYKSRTGTPSPSPGDRGAVTITSAEDDLILGLLRHPELAHRHRDPLARLEMDDPDAARILDAVLELDGENRLSVRELISVLEDAPAARERVMRLAVDGRTTPPERLVASALDALQRRLLRRAFRRVKEQGLRRSGASSAEANQLLQEIDRRLKAFKGARPRRDPDR